MAGAYKARAVRGKYAQAGYVQGETMYIADVPAGSAQDELRDFNRAGYLSERPWNETPVFETMAQEAAKPRAKQAVQNKTFLEKVLVQARRERRDVRICLALLAVLMVMTAMWCRQMVVGIQIQNRIAAVEESIADVETEIARKEMQLEQARRGDIIRDYAQNKMGMLRPERGQVEVIYIPVSDAAPQETVQNHEEPRMEMLDVLLGLLNVLHIGE